MAHIVSITGHTLRDMLIAESWTQEWERDGKCHMRPPLGGVPRGFPLSAALPVELVKSIAKNAGWTARQFEDIRSRVACSVVANTVLVASPQRLQ